MNIISIAKFQITVCNCVVYQIGTKPHMPHHVAHNLATQS